MFGIISSVCSAIASAFSSVTSVVIPTVVNALKVAAVTINAFASAIDTFFKGIGIIPQETSVNDIGNKAIQAENEGVKPEDFESFDDYMKKIESYSVDNSISEENASLKGLTIVSAKAVDTFGETSVNDFMSAISKNFDTMHEVISSKSVTDFVNINKENFSNLADFLSGKNCSGEIIDVLVKGDREVHPESSVDESIKKIEELEK